MWVGPSATPWSSPEGLEMYPHLRDDCCTLAHTDKIHDKSKHNENVVFRHALWTQLFLRASRCGYQVTPAGYSLRELCSLPPGLPSPPSATRSSSVGY